MIQRLLTSWRRWLLGHNGVALGPGARIGQDIDVRMDRGTIAFGANCQLERGVVLHAYGGSIRCGENVFLGPYVVIYGHGGVEIGENTLIAAHSVIVASNHTIPPAGVSIRSQPDILLPVKIGRDVWLAAGVTVLGGVTVGDGCVVGAGAVVTRNLPPYSIAHGVPARVVSERERARPSTAL